MQVNSIQVADTVTAMLEASGDCNGSRTWKKPGEAGHAHEACRWRFEWWNVTSTGDGATLIIIKLGCSSCPGGLFLTRLVEIGAATVCVNRLAL